MPDDSLSHEQITFQTIRNRDALLGLRNDWRRLWANPERGYYLPSLELLCEAYERIGRQEGQSLFVVVGRVGQRTVLICPFVLARQRFWRTVSWLSRDPIDYGDVIVERSPQAEIWIEAAIRYLISEVRCDVIKLDAVREDAAVAPVLNRIFPIQIGDDSAPFMDLSPWRDWEGFESKLSSKFRRELRRHLRRLEEAGSVAFDFQRRYDAPEKTVRWLVERKREWADERDIADPLGVSTVHADALIEMLRNRDAPEEAFIARLLLDDRLIAADIGFIVGDQYYADVGTFDLNWNKLSPGLLLLRETVKWALANSISRFDLGRGDDRYKSAWSDGETKIFRFIRPCNLWGKVYALIRTSNLFRRTLGPTH